MRIDHQLSYTHGSVVPLHIVIECSDMHGLELASAPSAPLVRFRRISHINYDAGGSNISGHHAKLSDLKPMSMTAFHDLIDWLNTATWWSTPCEKSEARTLQGEIHIRKNVRPSTLLGLYKLSVSASNSKTPYSLSFRMNSMTSPCSNRSFRDSSLSTHRPIKHFSRSWLKWLQHTHLDQDRWCILLPTTKMRTQSSHQRP